MLVKKKDGSLWAVAKQLLFPSLWIQILLMLAMICNAALSLAMPFSMKLFVDTVVPSRKLSLMFLFLGGILLLFVLASSVNFLLSLLISKTGETITRQARDIFFSKILNMPFQILLSVKSGDLISRFTNDISALQSALTMLFSAGLTNLLSFLASLIFLFALDWRLFLIGLGISPLFILIGDMVKQK